MTRPEQPDQPAPQGAAVEDDTFLGRWSRRKRATALGQTVPEEAPHASEVVAPVDGMAGSEMSSNAGAEPGAAVAEAPPALTDADMPPIESLDENSDYSGFFSPQVSEELRKLALRKLFRSSVFNVCDGLDDYDEDFTSFQALGDIVTSDMRYADELETRRKAAAEAKEAAELEAAQSPDAEGAQALEDQSADAEGAQALEDQPADAEGAIDREDEAPGAVGEAEQESQAQLAGDSDDPNARRLAAQDCDETSSATPDDDQTV